MNKLIKAVKLFIYLKESFGFISNIKGNILKIFLLYIINLLSFFGDFFCSLFNFCLFDISCLAMSKISDILEGDSSK